MSDAQNLVQKPKISAAILDDRKAYDKAQVFDISILQGCKYENIEKYKQIEVLKGVCCYIMEFCYPALKASKGKMAILACYMACRHGNTVPHTNQYGN